MKNTGHKNFLMPVIVAMAILAFILSGPGIFANATLNDRAGAADEGFYPVQLTNTDARVHAYEKAGRIKRLFGEAFSHGQTPMASAENFILSNAGLFGLNPLDLEFSHLQGVMYLRDSGKYKFRAVNYTQSKGDIPVFRSRLILLVRNTKGYPLVLASTDLRDLGYFEPNMAPRRLNPDRGIASAMKTFPSLVNFTEPEMVIWAGVEDMDVEPVVAFTFAGDNAYETDGATPEKYLFVTDAETGKILYLENRIIMTDVVGNVQGKATELPEADFCEDEVATDLPWARVSIGSTHAYANAAGDFVIPNSGSTQVSVESRLRGLWFVVSNAAGSDEVLTQSVTPPGPANFMHNNANTSEFVRAQVNGYLQANVVRDFVLTYNPSYPGLQQSEFPVNVNLTGGYCPGNAWYDYSSINFCQSGSGYPNTAWSSVIHHEYGHHLVNMAGSGQDAYGEGMGDTMSVLISDDPGLGYGFYGTCGVPLRNAVNTIQYPCSDSIHYCGQLLSGCVWETRNELVITNPGTYIDIISDLAINAMLVHTGSSIDPSITIDYLTLDDTNGNIYDGTPHYYEIDTGFSEHNMDAPDLQLLAFAFPGGQPSMISPDGGTTVDVVVSAISAQPQSGTGMFYYHNGAIWVPVPMSESPAHNYTATFPAVTCGDTLPYYFSAETTGSVTVYSPSGAPANFYTTISAHSITTVFSDNFETNQGWTVQNDPYLTSGAWQRGTPVGGGDRGDPPTDYDGSGQCYLTQNADGDTDVDGGITWLISPALDLSTAVDATVNYALWYTNDYGGDPNNDLFKVYVSNNNGTDWTLVETIGPVSPTGWNEHSFTVSDWVTPTSQVKVRFEASDLNTGSVVEAGVDAFSVEEIVCIQGPSDPVLSNGLVSPATGYYGTRFAYSVDYNDGDGDVPTLIQVNIDGTDYDMVLDSGTAASGTYAYSTRDIDVGVSHTYYFYAEEGTGASARYPSAGTLSGPTNYDPDILLSGTPGAGAWMTIEVWGAADALWAAAWSSEPGPHYVPVTGLFWDIGPGNLRMAKKFTADPTNLDAYGYGTYDFRIPNSVTSGTKYLQAGTKMNAYWGQTAQVTFDIP